MWGILDQGDGSVVTVPAMLAWAHLKYQLQWHVPITLVQGKWSQGNAWHSLAAYIRWISELGVSDRACLKN